MVINTYTTVTTHIYILRLYDQLKIIPRGLCFIVNYIGTSFLIATCFDTAYNIPTYNTNTICIFDNFMYNKTLDFSLLFVNCNKSHMKTKRKKFKPPVLKPQQKLYITQNEIYS